MSDDGGSGKNPKKLIMLVVAVLVLGGGGYGAFAFMKKKQAPPPAAPGAKGGEGAEEKPAAGGEEEEEEEEKPKGGGHGDAGGAPIFSYTDIVNLQAENGRKNVFLKFTVAVTFRDHELGKSAGGDKLTPEKAQVQALIQEKVSGKTLQEAMDLEAREALRLDIKDSLNEKFKPKPPKPGEKEDKEHKKPKHPIKDVLIMSWAVQQ